MAHYIFEQREPSEVWLAPWRESKEKMFAFYFDRASSPIYPKLSQFKEEHLVAVFDTPVSGHAVILTEAMLKVIGGSNEPPTLTHTGLTLPDGSVVIGRNEDDLWVAVDASDQPGTMPWDEAMSQGNLPTREELNLLWENRDQIPGGLEAIGIDTSGSYYWSSTEYTGTRACIQRVSDGYQNYNSKLSSYRARCVRRFSGSEIQAMLGQDAAVSASQESRDESQATENPSMVIVLPDLRIAIAKNKEDLWVVFDKHDKPETMTWNQIVVAQGDLPTREELNLLWENRDLIPGGLEAIGIDTSGSYYWSSTDYYGHAWLQRFSDGNLSSRTKTSSYRVRCARRFSGSEIQAMLQPTPVNS